ncbi:MAG: energy-coupling factor transporter transmembrane protein EcfT [Propionibacteriaceae bacterium]|nr:energy-coupling factor transporter transmembrane protein EcfT [Propionibacteriaceae bacterium]
MDVGIPPAAKPDPRAGLLMVALLAVGPAQIHSDGGSILLAAWAFAIAAVFGLGRRLGGLALGYVVLRLALLACVYGAALPVVPYLGITLTLMARCFPVYVMVWAIFTKAPMGELMAALAKLRLPGQFLIVAMVVYRYVPTLLGEMRAIQLANRLRRRQSAWRQWLAHPLRQAEELAVPVLMRSGKIADELSAVAICKGLDPAVRRGSLTEPRLQPSDLVAALGTGIAVAALIAADGWLKAAPL